MTHLEAVRMIDDLDFGKVVAWWLMAACQDIFNENPANAMHAERVALALLINADVDAYIRRFSWRIIQNATVLGRIDQTEVLANESDLGFVVNSVFNDYI